MAKSPPSAARGRQAKLDELFCRADAQYEKGDVKSAFRLFRAAANQGDAGCQLNLGNLYCHGIGVRANRDLALHWYRKAYRQRWGTAAYNIGLLFRDEKNFDQALAWLKRAVKLGDNEANLEIAEIYLREKSDAAQAIRHLNALLSADPVYITKGSILKGRRLLRKLTATPRPQRPRNPQRKSDPSNRPAPKA